jgi:hypothetical protein
MCRGQKGARSSMWAHERDGGREGGRDGEAGEDVWGAEEGEKRPNHQCGLVKGGGGVETIRD